jgi:hypothetical protein
MEAIRSSETSVLIRAHGVISQKIIIIIVTAVKTSNLTIQGKIAVYYKNKNKPTNVLCEVDAELQALSMSFIGLITIHIKRLHSKSDVCLVKECVR